MKYDYNETQRRLKGGAIVLSSGNETALTKKYAYADIEPIEDKKIKVTFYNVVQQVIFTDVGVSNYDDGLTQEKITNKGNFEKNVKPIASKLNKVFKADDTDFNRDGGIGYALHKQNKDESFSSMFVWYEDTENPDDDLLPEQFNKEKLSQYELIIQVEVNETDIECFGNVEDAIEYYKEHK
jgi:hypothetical protein